MGAVSFVVPFVVDILRGLWRSELWRSELWRFEGLVLDHGRAFQDKKREGRIEILNN